jgi:hypothetical protein
MCDELDVDVDWCEECEAIRDFETLPDGTKVCQTCGWIW